MRQQKDDVEYKVLARGDDALPCDDAAVLRGYFNAGTSLGQLAQLWAQSDPRFRHVHPYFPGRRSLLHHDAKAQGPVQGSLHLQLQASTRTCKPSALAFHA